MTIINSLWIGNRLSTVEKLAISSHVKQGHEYHLWTYKDIQDVPEGAIIRHACDILDEDEIFEYQTGAGKGSVSAFSNLFRYKLLKEQGGWWCDTDVIAVKPFDLEEPFVFASENVKRGGTVPTTCVIKVPPKSLIMNLCYKEASSVNRKTVEWGTIGPILLGQSIKTSKLDEKVVSPEMFCPINWWETNKLFGQIDVPEESCAIHLWNEMWRRNNFDKDGVYRSGSLFEELKEMYL